MRYLLALLVFATSLFAHAAVEGELLEPERAFRFSARVADANTLEVRFQIADGYYMYRDKFQFSLAPAGTTLGTPQLPPGKVKQDEFFGRVETFRKDVLIKLPLTRSGSDAQAITLKVTSQGCADAGVCYSPVEQFAKLTLPAGLAQAAPLQPLGGLAQLGADIGGNDDEFLPPEKAFTVNVTVRDANTLVADFKPEPTYYLYRDKIGLILKGAPGVEIEKITLPPGEVKDDPIFGKTEVYHNAVQAIVTLKRAATAPQAFEVIAKYQGCSEKGVCYPPLEKSFSLNLAQANAPAPAAANEGVAQDDDSRVAALFQAGNLWPIVLAFFGFGLLLSFTPCVFPMIPILSGIIIGQGASLTKSRAFVLSLAYVLGMALTYALAGIAAGLSGTLLSAALQNPWVLGVFAAVFVALAFSMFGFYDLQLPSFVQSKFSDASNKVKGGSVPGVFIMGALSAVIVGPCVAAPLAGALLYIGQTHNVVLGGAALFAMALGMGVPLLLVGLSAGTLLPRAGGWMDAVKAFFGVLLLAVAIYLITPVIPNYVSMTLWAALLIIAAMYLRPLDSLPPDASGFKRFWKGIGVIALVWGIALLVGMLGGNRDVLQPLKFPRSGGAVASAPGTTADDAALPFVRVKSVAELEQKLQDHAGHYVMLDFYADWCISCKELERFTFADPAVRQKLSGVVLLQADVTANNADDKALLKRFNLFGPPGIIFFDKNGKESGRVIGFQKPEKFIASMSRAMP